MNFRYGILQGAYWAAYCSVYTFFVPLFESYGFPRMTTSLILVCGMIFLALAQPLWGILCDKLGRVKPVLLSVIAAGMVGSLLLPLGAGSVFLTLIAVIVFASTYQSLMYVYDTWSIRLRNDGADINFGITRGVGSASFAVGAALIGSAFDKYGFGIMTPLFLILSALVFIMTLSIKDVRPPAPKDLDSTAPLEKDSFSSGLKKLVKNKTYLILLLGVFLAFFGNSGIMMCFPLRVAEIGGGNSEYGLALFIMAMAEVPALLLYRRLAVRTSSFVLLCISMFFMSLKIAAIALSPQIWMIVALQVLQAPSYGIYLSSIANYVPEIVSRRTIFTAQTAVAAVVSIAGICSNLFAGVMITAFGIQIATISLIGFPLAGLLVLWVFTSKTMRKISHVEEDDTVLAELSAN